MLEARGRPTLVERITRLETLFQAEMSEQARREEDMGRRWRELSEGLRALDARLDKFEPAILGDAAAGRKSLGERMEAVEHVVLSAKAGWRMTTVLGAALLGFSSFLAFVSHQAAAFFGLGHSSQR